MLESSCPCIYLFVFVNFYYKLMVSSLLFKYYYNYNEFAKRKSNQLSFIKFDSTNSYCPSRKIVQQRSKFARLGSTIGLTGCLL